MDVRSALITGASRGLGLALAQALAADGWALVVDARNQAALEEAIGTVSTSAPIRAIAGDIADPRHRALLAEAAHDLGGLDSVINNAGTLGASPLPALLDYPLTELEDVFRTNVVAQLGVLQAVRSILRPGGRILNITSDAGIEAYEGWGGYGASKAALEQLSAVLAIENPSLRIYWVDPGDMRTQMQQDAFPGEDISDRPPPGTSVPGLLRLLAGDLPSGRYAARDLAPLPA